MGYNANFNDEVIEKAIYLPGSFEVSSARRSIKIVRCFGQEMAFLASGKVMMR